MTDWPDYIPEDIREATECASKAALNRPALPVIAEAIWSERQRCAQFHLDLAKHHDSCATKALDSKWHTTQAECHRGYAKAILGNNRKEDA